MNNAMLSTIAQLAQNVTGKQADDISQDYSLSADLGIDSILMVELIIALEETFNFEFDDMDLNMDNFISISTICELLEKKYVAKAV